MEPKLASPTSGLGFGALLSAKSSSTHHSPILISYSADLSEAAIDEWGTMLSSRPTSPSPDPWMSQPHQVSRALSPQPRKATARSTSTHAPAFSPASSARSTPISSPPPLPNAAEPVQTSLAGLSKEEKAAEMARRKEERRLVSVIVLFIYFAIVHLCLFHSGLRS